MKKRNHNTLTKSELIKLFWTAPDEALLPTKVVAAGLGLSSTTLEIYRIRGAGPVFMKRGNSVLYTKKDVLAWHDSKTTRVSSTSELNAA